MSAKVVKIINKKDSLYDSIKTLLIFAKNFNQRHHEDDKKTDRARGEQNGSRRKKIKN